MPQPSAASVYSPHFFLPLSILPHFYQFSVSQISFLSPIFYLAEVPGCLSDIIETQDHILWCPAYHELREGKSLESDKDLIEYFGKVMKIREKLNLNK